MGVENKPALLLYGPSYFDGRRPTSGMLIKDRLQRTAMLGPAIVSAFLKRKDIPTRGLPMEPDGNRALEAAIEAAGSVWISSRYFDSDLAGNAIRIAHRHGKQTVVGGYGPTFAPQLFEGATTRVAGEGEPILETVIDDFLHGTLQPSYDSRNQPLLDLSNNYTWPDRSVLPPLPKAFSVLNKTPQEWERGCPNACTFCSPTRMQNQAGKPAVRYRTPEDIIAEIEHLGLRRNDNLFVVDLNTTAIPPEILRDVFTYLKSAGIRWYAEGTVAPLLDDLEKNGPEKSLLSLMSAQDGGGGCFSFMYGADDLTAEKVKGAHDKEKSLLEKAARVFHEYGIPLNLSVVVGLDHHRYPDSFFQIAQALEEIRVPYSFNHIATPYLGTPWGDSVYKEGRAFDESSLHHNHRRVVHEPKGMTPEELQQGYYWLQAYTNSPKQLALTARANTPLRTARGNPALATILSGLPWGVETYLAMLEIKARGYLDPSHQRELNEEFRKWKRKE